MLEDEEPSNKMTKKNEFKWFFKGRRNASERRGWIGENEVAGDDATGRSVKTLLLSKVGNAKKYKSCG